MKRASKKKTEAQFERSDAYQTLSPADIRLLTGAVGDEPEHVVIVRPHDVANCHTAKFAPDKDCGTRYEANCSCDFGQGALSEEHAEIIAERHITDPTEVPVFVEKGRPSVVKIPERNV